MSETLTGKIYSYTEVQRDNAPSGYLGLAPYFLALVQLDHGPMLTGQLTDLGALRPEIDMPVEMVTRKLQDGSDERGVIQYGYKFRPLIEHSTPEQVAALYHTIRLVMQGIFE